MFRLLICLFKMTLNDEDFPFKRKHYHQSDRFCPVVVFVLNLNSLLVKRQIDNPSPGAVTGGN